MNTVPETTSNLGFVRPVFFERTEKVRERIVDCTREELIDLTFHQLDMIQKAQDATQSISESMEKHLGWIESR